MIGIVLSVALSTLQAPADVVLLNGKIITVDSTFRVVEAVAVKEGKFTAVGTTSEVARLAGAETRRIDLGGRTVVPGLADNHLHSAGGGPGVDLSRARNLADVLSKIAERAAKSQPGEVLVTNSDWHEGQLREQRLPYRRDLDAVTPRNPLVVVRGGHEYVLNTAALEKWNITKATPEPPGGRIGRDEQGELNGELVDTAKSLVKLPPPPALSEEEQIPAIVAEHRKLAAAGLTSIRYPGAPVSQYKLLLEMKRRGLLSMRVNFLFRVGRPMTPEALRSEIATWAATSSEGDDWLRVGGVKLGVDGGFEGGWMTAPYEEPWGEGGRYRGLQTFPAEAYASVVSELNRLGWRVATHAVGDAAIDQVLTAYEAADRERSIAGRRWTIEHGFLPRLEHFPRMKKLGLAISAQNHLYLAGPSLVKYWGAKRARWVTPLRAYIDAGIPVSLGTDSPVVPYPPLWVVYHFVTRDTLSAGVLGADQKVSRAEAIRAVTYGNAYLTFEENQKGSIEPGKWADLVVLSSDILGCPEKEIESTRVLLTMVGGKETYRDPAFAQ